MLSIEESSSTQYTNTYIIIYLINTHMANGQTQLLNKIYKKKNLCIETYAQIKSYL